MRINDSRDQVELKLRAEGYDPEAQVCMPHVVEGDLEFVPATVK